MYGVLVLVVDATHGGSDAAEGSVAAPIVRKMARVVLGLVGVGERDKGVDDPAVGNGPCLFGLELACGKDRVRRIGFEDSEEVLIIGLLHQLVDIDRDINWGAGARRSGDRCSAGGSRHRSGQAAKREKKKNVLGEPKSYVLY